MPGIALTSLDRRRFLQLSAVGGAVIACPTWRASAGPSQDRLHLALLSDTHIPGDRENGHRGMNPWKHLQQIVPQVVAAQTEGVIINGDAARLEGLLQDYQELQSLLEPIASTTPVYIGLGNHDDRANFAKVFTAPPGQRVSVAGKHTVVIEHPVVRVVVLDSLLYVNRVAGLLGKNQREWLAEYLPAHADRPLVLFLHHTLGDGDGDLLDTDRLFALLEPHPHVKAIFYGHSHRWSITERPGLKLINLPAVGYNFSDQEPVGWVDALFHPDGVQLTLRVLAGNRAEDGRMVEVAWA